MAIQPGSKEHAVSLVLSHIQTYVDKFAKTDERGTIHYTIMCGERKVIMERAPNGRKYPRLIYVRSKRTMSPNKAYGVCADLYGNGYVW